MSNKVKNGDLPASEMTKREDIAKAIMASIMTDPCVTHGMYPDIAQNSIHAADALLAALEKSK